MKFKRKLVTGLLGLATLCGCLGAFVFSNCNVNATQVNAVSEEHDHSDWTPISSLPNQPGNYYLIGDIDVQSTWIVSNGTTNLCLNGYVIKVTQANEKYSVINVNNGATLNIHDCNNLSKHYFQYRTDTCWRFLGSTTSRNYIQLNDVNENTPNDTVVEVYGGCITGTYSWEGQHGGAIAVNNNSKLNLYGGNVIGNSTFKSDGGGIYATQSSSVNIAGGNVIGNVGTFGGGIAIADSSSLNMSSGSISYNSAWSVKGGGVILYNLALSFNFSGGTISYNVANKISGGLGGGVYIACPSFIMSGDALISHNRTNGVGGGIYIESGKNFNLVGGSILNNSAVTNGGGIYSYSSFIMDGGTISNNKVTSTNAGEGCGGGVWVGDNSTFTLNDGTISNNSAQRYGGGVQVRTNATFNMNEGSILNNTSLTYGGGGINSDGTATINGGTIIGNNCKNNDGHQIRIGGASTLIQGYCTISSNTNDLSGVTKGDLKTHIYFDKQGGIGGSDVNDNQIYDKTMNTITTPTNYDYEFLGYFDAPVGGTQYYTSSGTSARNWAFNKYVKEATLYAHWNINVTYRIYLECPYNDSVWNYNVSGVNPGVYYNNAWHSMYYDHETVRTYSDGSRLAARVCYADIPSTITSIKFGISNETTVDITGNILPGKVFYLVSGGSQWAVKVQSGMYHFTANITLDSNGGTSSGGCSYHYGYDIKMQPLENLIHAINVGYTLSGYFTSPTGGMKVIDPDGTIYQNIGGFTDYKYWINTNPQITLYAHWTVNSYTVLLDIQGGTGGTSTVTATFDAEMPEITLPSREYCDFGGYFTEVNGKGTQYYNADGTSARNWNIASDTTLYAYWIKTIENFSKEFLMKTTTGNYCDKTKGIDLDKSIQDDLFTSFCMVDSDGKTAFKNAEWVRGHSQIYENDIVEAKSRYCYMVVELGINDFLNLFTESELKALMHRGSIVSLFNDGEDGSSIILVASLSILTITTITAYILFRKRKEE